MNPASARALSCRPATTSEDEEGVEKKEGGNRNEEPRPDAHACSLVLVYADQEAGRRLHELARAVG
jgi:hypothetical protein